MNSFFAFFALCRGYSGFLFSAKLRQAAQDPESKDVIEADTLIVTL